MVLVLNESMEKGFPQSSSMAGCRNLRTLEYLDFIDKGCLSSVTLK